MQSCVTLMEDYVFSVNCFWTLLFECCLQLVWLGTVFLGINHLVFLKELVIEDLPSNPSICTTSPSLDENWPYQKLKSFAWHFFSLICVKIRARIWRLWSLFWKTAKSGKSESHRTVFSFPSLQPGKTKPGLHSSSQVSRCTVSGGWWGLRGLQ